MVPYQLRYNVAYEILLAALEKTASVLPALILRRVYTQARLEKQVIIDTRTANPIEFSLGSSVPRVHAWFTLANLSNFAWRVRDFSAEIWLGQPIATVTCKDKPTISRKRMGSIFAESFLSEIQVRRVNEFKSRRAEGNVGIIAVYVNAQLESRLGLVQFKLALENRPISIC